MSKSYRQIGRKHQRRNDARSKQNDEIHCSLKSGKVPLQSGNNLCEHETKIKKQSFFYEHIQ